MIYTLLHITSYYYLLLHYNILLHFHILLVTHIDDVGLVSCFQVIEYSTLVEVGKERHVGTVFVLWGVHWLTVIDIRTSFLKIIPLMRVMRDMRETRDMRDTRDVIDTRDMPSGVSTIGPNTGESPYSIDPSIHLK